MPSVLRGRHRSLPGGRRTESRRGKGLPVERTRADSPSRPSCGRSRLTRRRRSGSEKPLLLSHRTRSSGDIPANSTLRRSRISRVVFTQSNPFSSSRGRHFLPPSCRSRYVTDISRSDRVARGAVLCPHSGHELRSLRTDQCWEPLLPLHAGILHFRVGLEDDAHVPSVRCLGNHSRRMARRS